jgi:hypothetical protein
MAKFAFVVNNSVKYVLSLTSDSEVNNKWIAALKSDIVFKDASLNYGLAPLDLFIDNKFYKNNNGNLVEVVENEDWQNSDSIRIAGIIDGEVIGMRIINKDAFSEEDLQRIVDAFLSNSSIIEISEDSQVSIGWNWDGDNFSEPSN